MEPEKSLKIILALSVLGMLFSGYLSYSELFGGTCPVGGCSMVAGVPACVYGFIMYLVVFVVSFLGLKGEK